MSPATAKGGGGSIEAPIAAPSPACAPNILVGPAGWVYPDWKGLVYPARASRGFEPLPFLARLFDAVEVDSTFYRIPEPFRTAEWARKVSDFPRFRFAVKLFQGFTHARKATLAEERAFQKALGPLSRAGRLAAVLLQWPWSFQCTTENRSALGDLLARFRGFPLAVELRHGSWASAETLTFLRERGATFCNIDQPALAQCTGPTDAVTENLAYFRFHGRNAAAWFSEGAGRDERYNYLYGEGELSSWLDPIRKSAAAAETVVVIFNNHFRGKAAANAFQLLHALAGNRQEVPSDLLREYPHLQAISSTIFQPSLF